MTVETTLRKKIYHGNGVTTMFPVPFPVVEEKSLYLVVTDAKGRETPITSNYQVHMMDGLVRSVTYPSNGKPLPKGEKLTIYRKVLRIQPVDLTNAGAFHPDELERMGFDRIVMMVQEVQEDADRAVKVDISSEDNAPTAKEFYDSINQIADRAEDAARRAERVGHGVTLEAGLENLRGSWVTPKAVKTGEELTLAVNYSVGCNALLLSMDGLVCYPLGKFTDETIPQYEEVGKEGELSHKVRLLFDAPAGAAWDALVISTGAKKAVAEVKALYVDVAEHAKSAKGFADKAADSATTAANAVTAADGYAEAAAASAVEAKKSSPIKLDALAADGTSTAAPGGFGLGVLFGAQLPENTDLNAINKPGFYNCRWGINAKTMKNIPADVGGDGFSLLVEGSNYGSAQTLTEHGGVKAIYRRSQTDQNVFSQWVRMPSGITDVITDNADLAISGKAVVSAGYVPKSRKVLVNGKEAGDLSADLDLKVGSGETIGSQKWWDSVNIPNGWVNISQDVGPMPRDAFPQAWEHAKDSQNILSDTDWLAQVAEFGFCGAYSYGDGATTFRFPLIRGAFIRAVDSEKGRGLGTNQGDAIRNIEGAFGWEKSGIFQIADGAFKGVPRKNSVGAYGADGVSTQYRAVSFDASLVVPTADENRPANVSYIRILKVYDEEAEPGLVDVQVLISKINEVADLVMSEAHIRKLAGTKEGRVLAWAMIDSSVAPPVIKASGNIASVVREAANGYLTATFLKPLDTDCYSVTGAGSNGSTPYTAGPVAVQPYALKKSGFSFYTSANSTYALLPNIFIQIVGV